MVAATGTGVVLHLLGGAASGSFYVPLGNVQAWAWESSWLVAGLFSWLLLPPLVAHWTLPGYAAVIAASSPGTLLLVFGFGVLWGVGGSVLCVCGSCKSVVLTALGWRAREADGWCRGARLPFRR